MPNFGAYSLPVPSGSAVPDVVAALQTLVTRLTATGLSVGQATNKAAIDLIATPILGMRVLAQDTGIEWRYDGSSWVTPEGAVHPSSVANGTINADGSVSFSAASSVSLNGVFGTTGMNAYRIVVSLAHSTATTTTMRLRASGTDNSSSNYDRQLLQGSSSSSSAAQGLAASSWAALATASSNTLEIAFIDIIGAGLAVATRGVISGLSTENPMTTAAGAGITGIQHRSATAFDGFSLIPTTGTITGTVKVMKIA